VISATTEGISDCYYDIGNYSVKKVIKGRLKYANFDGLIAVLMRSKHFWDVTLCLLV
jgi:hypothetical protein